MEGLKPFQLKSKLHLWAWYFPSFPFPPLQVREVSFSCAVSCSHPTFHLMSSMPIHRASHLTPLSRILSHVPIPHPISYPYPASHHDLGTHGAGPPTGISGATAVICRAVLRVKGISALLGSARLGSALLGAGPSCPPAAEPCRRGAEGQHE